MPAMANTTRPPQPFTRESCAKFLGLHIRTVDRLLASGDLEAIQVGTRRLIPARSVRAFLGEDDA